MITGRLSCIPLCIVPETGRITNRSTNRGAENYITVTVMLHVLPVEVTLSVLCHLPIPWLLSLPVLSRQWSDFFFTNESEIFHSAAIFHEYIKPEIRFLEDALSVNTGRPWAGSTSWKDFCESFHLHHLSTTINDTYPVPRILKAAGLFNFAKTGKEKDVVMCEC